MMKKKLFSLLTAGAMVVTALPLFSMTGTAADNLTIPTLNIESKGVPDLDCFKFTADMGTGWNLGNTFDATDDKAPQGQANLNLEYAWVGTKTTQGTIDAVKKAGFNTLRLPVSWHNHVDADYKINTQWLDRVQEVVDYAVANDMYIILNIHHDNAENYMFPNSAHFDNSLKYVTSIWTQVSEEFKDYDEHLIFETLNEPRLVGHTNEWWYTSSSADCVDAANCLNKLNQAAVDTIRKSGGKNGNRYIMVPAYCANIDAAISNEFKLPTDTATNRIILSVHSYSPYNFALQAPTESGSTSSFDINGSGGKDISNLMDTIYIKFISKNIPVVIGEYGSRNKDDNTQARIDCAAFYAASARARGITCCWWDNHCFATHAGEAFGILDRNTNTWKYPEIAQALTKYGSGKDQEFVIPGGEDIGGGEAGDVMPNGTVIFSSPIGEKVALDVKLADNCGYANGCLAFDLAYNGVTYWGAYQWSTSESGKVYVDMTAISMAVDTTQKDENGDALAVTDEAILAELSKAAMASTKTTIQYWYAADKDGNQIDPASDAASIVSASLLTPGEVITTTTTATTTTTTETTTKDNTTTTTTTTVTTTVTGTQPDDVLPGDVNDNGIVQIADVVMLARYVSQDPEITLTAKGKQNADFNADGSLDASDIAGISKWLAGNTAE